MTGVAIPSALRVIGIAAIRPLHAQG